MRYCPNCGSTALVGSGFINSNQTETGEWEIDEDSFQSDDDDECTCKDCGEAGPLHIFEDNNCWPLIYF